MWATFKRRLNYYRRIFDAYLIRRKSHLTFWHGIPEPNERFSTTKLCDYYMVFAGKADYPGPYNENGIPLLDYHGKIGLQYNPIAIAQYGLGNYNLFLRNREDNRRRKFLRAADWLVTNLETNHAGLWVWHHHFDWDYRTLLRAPWYSGLAQGQGISLLVRAHQETGDSAYLDAAKKSFQSFHHTTDEGGVTFRDPCGHIWFEEYIVSPPTHILNGFIWASWGIYDYFLATDDARARRLFDAAVHTMCAHLHEFDAGFWSLYEQSGTRLKMLASPFYHHLHIVQLHILERMTGEETFRRYACRWEGYQRNRSNRTAALLYKSLFKICYY